MTDPSVCRPSLRGGRNALRMPWLLAGLLLCAAQALAAQHGEKSEAAAPAGATALADAAAPALAYLPAVDHLGIVVRDADQEAARLEQLFGAKTVHRETIRFRSAQYQGRTLAFSAYFVFVDMGNTKIEFVQPDPELPSPYLDILNAHGEYAHHLCFLVPSIDEALQRFQRLQPGLEVVVQAQADTAQGGRMVYLKGLIPGTLVELAEPLQ